MLAVLKALVEAGTFAVESEDDVAIMLRLGQATDDAKAAIAKTEVDAKAAIIKAEIEQRERIAETEIKQHKEITVIDGQAITQKFKLKSRYKLLTIIGAIIVAAVTYLLAR